jgi:hypothetical protein
MLDFLNVILFYFERNRYPMENKKTNNKNNNLIS